MNDRHRDTKGDKFFVLHRERGWNASERVWMGWERKRGKLIELHRLLRDPAVRTSFAWILGAFAPLAAGSSVRYVVTFDEDMWVTPGQITHMIRTAAHPLNRPVFDPALRRVVAGYGILQPSVRGIPPLGPFAHNRTHFFKLSAGYFVEGRRGPDLTGARGGAAPADLRNPRDFELDVFGECRYSGKGLYDVDAFWAAVDGVFPDNAVLSHDVLEGFLARTATVRDAYIIEPAPTRFAASSAQEHRWQRGDFQAAPWLFPRVRNAQHARFRNPISGAARLRIGGLMLGHTHLPATLALLLLGWLVLRKRSTRTG